MEDLRTQQLEALEGIQEYNKKLKPGVKNVIDELRGEKQPDTDEFFKTVTTGINWVIEVVNLIMPMLNEEKERINKEAVNAQVVALSDAISKKDEDKIAAILEQGILAFLETLDCAAEELLVSVVG